MGADDLLTITNHAPSDEERGKLPRYHGNHHEKLDALNKRISELEEQLESAKIERMALFETATRFQQPLAPFLRLPQDVIREIFIACLDPETNPTMSKKEAPTLLTQICSGLRCIALASPELWAAIHIPIIDSMPASISDYAQYAMNKQADGVKEWLLRRSGNLPLRISVRRSSDSHMSAGSAVTLTNDIMDVVLSCCSRWRDVFFAVGYRVLFLRFAELGPEDVPLLRSFYHTLGVDRDSLSAVDRAKFWPSCRFLAGPNLRRFCANTTIYGNDFSRLLLSIPINWRNLTHLGFLGSSPSDNHCVTLCNTLRQCPRLISLKMLCFRSGHPGMGTIELPALRFLEIQEFPGTRGLLNDPGILAVIFAPALNALVYNREDEIVEEPKNLLTLLKRAPNLTHLTLGVCSADTLLECVQHCPHLVYLELDKMSYPSHTDSIKWSDQFLPLLFLNDDCLCPHLDHFGASNIFTPSLETIHSIIHRKNGTVPHLAQWKALQLCICYESQDSEEIEKLRAEVTALDGRKQIDIHFCQVFQTVRDVVNDVGNHTQLHTRRDPCLPEDNRIQDTWQPWRHTWPSSDAWPLGECP